MVRQYLEERPDGLMDSYAMSAGEHAIEALADFGDMEKVAVGRIFAAFLRNNQAGVGAGCRTYPSDFALRWRLVRMRRR
ncbi:hypothetical protein AC244_30340 [Ensifer adhaerens]|uniref:Uncharacterized protein n=1 Tax=Ensifer adhaerens TaxID=106592 RepID=A0A0L8BFV5_ENSAD|nr:hypothetical protein AC244_30340 [Ensifer adhaerens]